jgi:hypothetical protein
MRQTTRSRFRPRIWPRGLLIVALVGFASNIASPSIAAPLDPGTLSPYVYLNGSAGLISSGIGTPVTEWIDLSAANNVFHANHPLAGANNPLHVAGPNGTDAVRFDGSDILDSDSPLQLFTANNSALTIFTVMKPNVSGGQQFLFNHSPGVGGDSFEMGPDAGQVATPGAWGIHRGSGLAASTAANQLSNGAFQIMTTEINSVGANGSNVAFFKNGQYLPNAANSWLAPGSYATGSDPLAIGARVDNKGQGFDTLAPNSFFNGDLAAVVVFREKFSDATRQGIEEYLGNTFGIGVTQSSAPPPVIPPQPFLVLTNPTQIDGSGFILAAGNNAGSTRTVAASGGSITFQSDTTNWIRNSAAGLPNNGGLPAPGIADTELKGVVETQHFVNGGPIVGMIPGLTPNVPAKLQMIVNTTDQPARNYTINVEGQTITGIANGAHLITFEWTPTQADHALSFTMNVNTAGTHLSGFVVSQAAAPPTSVGETIGDVLARRPNRDGASGGVYIYAGAPFTRNGVATEFEFVGEVAGRQLTPVLLELESGSLDGNNAKYVITGVGTPVMSNGSLEPQSTPFALMAGSAAVSASHTFGYFDGVLASDGAGGVHVVSYNQGAVDFDGNGGGNWAFTGNGQAPIGLALGMSFAAGIGPGGNGSNLSPFQISSRMDGNGRIYSAQMHSVPEPSSIVLFALGAVGVFVVRRKSVTARHG